MTLAFSVHPVSLLQVVVAGLFGEVPTSLRSFWGHRFFSGFPYFLSLYLGAAVLAVASIGLVQNLASSAVRRVALLGLGGLLVSLGPWVGLGEVIERLPFLAAFRFPSKAFFLVHLATALLFGWGLGTLCGQSSRTAWRRLAVGALLIGVVLVSAPLLPRLLPTACDTVSRGFFPEAYSVARRHESLALLAGNAALGGWVSLLVGLVSLGFLRGFISHGLAPPLILAAVAADLLRAGVPVNPMVDASVWAPSPESREVAAQVRASGGRLFTCSPGMSPSLFRLLSASRIRDDYLALMASRGTLEPGHNMGLRVPTALSLDISGFVPENRAFETQELGCRRLGDLVERLRRAGVSHVLSLEGLVASGLTRDRVLRPRSLGGLTMTLLRVEDPLPGRQIARRVVRAASAPEAEALAARSGFLSNGGAAIEGFPGEVQDAAGTVKALREDSSVLEFEVLADRPTALVVRDAFAEGWRATVNGEPVPVLRADGRHRAVPVPAGSSSVRLDYHPPGLRAGCWIGAVSLLLVLGLSWPWLGRRRLRTASEVGSR